MIPLASKTNVDAPSTAYPFGNVRNNPGDSSGTPVNVQLVGDAMQFFEALMVAAGVTPNGQPESYTYGFQLMAALAAYIRAQVLAYYASTTQVGVSRFATFAEVITGTAVDIGVTPGALTNWFNSIWGQAWTLRSNVGDVTVAGGSGTTVSFSTIKWKKVGKILMLNGRFVVTNSTAPSSFLVLLPGGNTNATGFETPAHVDVFNVGVNQVLASGAITSGGNSIGIVPSVALSDTISTEVRFSATIEVV